MDMEDLRQLHLRGATGAVRTEILDGREHLVVPVIALMDTVIHAVNAESPERTPLEVLKKAAASFNGRPVMLGHPSRNGRQISANDPSVIATHGLGTVYNSRVENGKLQMEAWIDTEKAQRIAGAEYVANVRAAKPHDVSVGAFVVADSIAGTHANGRPYSASWVEANGDHLAMLPGGVGACSMAMGCGTHRAAAHLVTAEGIDMPELETLRDIPQSERDKMDASDFAGPDESFPIKTQADVDAAKSLIGKAKDPDAVKAKIIAIAKRKGLTIPKAWHMKSLRQRVVELIRGAQEDGPAEEAAEVVQYKTMQSLFGQCGESYDEAMTIIKELLAAEATPTTTDEEEAAEEEIESARVESVISHCMQMIGSLTGVMNVGRALLADDDDPGYGSMMAMADGARALLGKRHSTSDQQLVQQMHDQSVSLGADCPTSTDIRAMENVKAASEHDCNCGAHAAEGDNMTKVERVKALIAAKDSGYSADDAKWLEQVPDARLEALETQATAGMRSAATKADAEKVIADKHSADQALAAHAVGLKAKKDDEEMKAASEAKLAETEAKLKAAQAQIIPAEELNELRTLAAEKRALDAAKKAVIIGQLKTAGAFTEDELNAKPLDELQKLATLAKVDAPVDYSGRVIPRVAADAKDVFLNPPDPYSLAIAARHKTAVN